MKSLCMYFKKVIVIILRKNKANHYTVFCNEN